MTKARNHDETGIVIYLRITVGQMEFLRDNGQG
jgi:hypothetical protein